MEPAKFTMTDRLSVMSLTPLPNHPRNHPPGEDSDAAKEDVKWMRVNIANTGMIDPVKVVQVNDGKYHIIDGVRRVRAADQLGMDYINCIVYLGISEAESAHISYQLNTMHPSNPLTATEEAHHLRTMRDKYAYSYSDLEEMGYGSKSEILSKISDDDITAEPEVQTPEIKTTETDQVVAGDDGKNQVLKSDIPLIHHAWKSALAGTGINRQIFQDRERVFPIPFYGQNPTTNKIHIQNNNL
jgi:ParB/RepB/Spo0J family partition protein